mgnify:FL=1
MKIKNNSKNLTSIKQKNINYSINEFFSLDMFNPITQRSYFDKYDLSIFKKKNLELMCLVWVDRH